MSHHRDRPSCTRTLPNSGFLPFAACICELRRMWQSLVHFEVSYLTCLGNSGIYHPNLAVCCSSLCVYARRTSSYIPHIRRISLNGTSLSGKDHPGKLCVNLVVEIASSGEANSDAVNPDFHIPSHLFL
ncbi:hypothetical protein C8R42DRAFT_684846 [Lentinula raphanica]|nr:hypothetical protein C8R42DRAFT_684846 [Lentinula raphanica]